MKRFLFLLLATYSIICSAQEYTVSIGQHDIGRYAVIDQEIALNDTVSVEFMYVPKVGKLEFPTLILTFSNLEDAFLGKSCEVGECMFQSLNIVISTSKGDLNLFAEPSMQNIEHKFIDDKYFTSITMILPAVNMVTKDKWIHAKKNAAWGKKIKAALSEPNNIYDIKLSTTITSYNPATKSYKQKDVKYKINAPLEYGLSSLLTKLFIEGDKAILGK